MRKNTVKMYLMVLIFALLAATLCGCGAGDDLEFTLYNQDSEYTVSLKGLSASMRSTKKSITVPDQYDGKPVTSILKEGFRNAYKLEKITIPDSIVLIDAYAFQHTAITTITIPKNVRYIGDYAFYDCENLKEIYYDGTIEEWNAIEKGHCLTMLASSTSFQNSIDIVHCSDGNTEI